MKILWLLFVLVITAAAPLAAEEGKAVDLLRQGNEFLQSQDYQKAAQAFKEAARIDPGSAEAQRGMGIAYLKIGYSEGATNVEMVQDAVSALKEAVRLAPSSSEARYHLGVAYLIVYDKESATKEYQALRDLDPVMAEQLHSRIKEYRQPKSFGKMVSRGGAEGEITRVTMAGNHALVPVTVSHGSKTAQITLVLDTGASATLITSDVAKRLDMKFHDAAVAKFQVADGRVVQAWHMKLDRVTVGPNTKTGLDVVIVESGTAFPFDGLLGMDFLRSFKHSIDVGNQVINWGQ